MEKFTQYRLGYEVEGKVISYTDSLVFDETSAKSWLEEERKDIDSRVHVFLVKEEVTRERIDL